MKSYFVLNECIKGDPLHDTFSGEFESFEAANECAQNEWLHTIDLERKNRAISVCSVDLEEGQTVGDALESGAGYTVLKVYSAEADQNRPWYAVMLDREDSDWGTGSHDQQEAIEIAQKYRRDGYPDAYVAVIDDGDDPVCINEIHDLENN